MAKAPFKRLEAHVTFLQDLSGDYKETEPSASPLVYQCQTNPAVVSFFQKILLPAFGFTEDQILPQKVPILGFRSSEGILGFTTTLGLFINEQYLEKRLLHVSDTLGVDAAQKAIDLFRAHVTQHELAHYIVRCNTKDLNTSTPKKSSNQNIKESGNACLIHLFGESIDLPTAVRNKKLPMEWVNQTLTEVENNKPFSQKLPQDVQEEFQCRATEFTCFALKSVFEPKKQFIF